ncbi:MAG: prepilin-type N-terminal cleavage/methylation domain-containing protein [Pyrinomonadaceae bacterium]
MNQKIRRQAGFNLIELMIVIAIIAILIAVGVPAWQAMVKSGNETAAVQTLSTIRTLQAQYASKHQGNFAPNFDRLIQTVALDDKFKGEAPVVSGYVFKMQVQEASASKPSFYSINADPQVATGLQATGSRFFYTDSSLGTIKQNEEEPAKVTDPSV